MSREILETLGVRGNRRCLVIRDGDRIVVERYVKGKPLRKSWPDTRRGEAAARLWAHRWYDAGGVAAAPARTVRGLWEAYLRSPAYEKLRPRTKLNYRHRWERFELFVKAGTPADDVSVRQLDDLWTSLLGQMVPNQARAVFTVAKVVFRWAESRELLTRNRVALYQLPRGSQYRAMQVPEYAPEEAERIAATARPQDGRRWRFGALWQFLMAHGTRFNAAVHIRWEDVDLEAGTVRLVEEYDKTHKTLVRPLTWGSYAALLTARYWRERTGYRGPWVFFSGQPARRDEPWSYQAANQALRRAEAEAGVPHVPYRAFHGERREVAGTARRLTGDAALAMHHIGDDVRQANRYLKEREAELADLADRMGR
jgi:integrase